MTNLEYYRVKATEMRELAAGARNPDICRQFAVLAAEYDRLGNLAMSARAFPAAGVLADREVTKPKQIV